MSDIPYLSPGVTPLDASHMDAIVAAANAKLVKLFNGQPLFLVFPVPTYTVGLCWKKFFFCSDVNPDPTSIANIAIANYPDSETDPEATGTVNRFWKRAYDHTMFTNAATFATVDSGGTVPFNDPAAPVVRIVPQDDTDWPPIRAAIWPDNPTNAEFSCNILEYSLEAHKKIGGDYDGFYIFEDGCANAEYEHWWEQVEIIIGEGFESPFAWPANYTKYRLFRFHNLLPEDVTIQFPRVDHDGSSLGTYDVIIPAMGSKCVRRVNLLPAQVWVAGYDYFQKPLPLDPWFAHGQKFNNLTNPFSIADMLYASVPFVGDGRFDFRDLWNPGIIYSGVQTQKTGFPYFLAPAGGWFSRIENDNLIGDLLAHRGKLLCVSPAGPFTVTRPEPQVVTLSGVTTTVTLRKVDNSIALGVEDVTVIRKSDSASIGDAGGDNWTLSDLTDHFELTFTTGADLADGDVLDVRFKHLTDDQKFVFDFKGFDSITEQLALAGITVTAPDPEDLDQSLLLTSEDDKDLIGLSSNLILAAFGSPAVTVYGSGASLSGLIPIASAVKLTATNTGVSASYKTWTGANLTTWEIHFDADVAVNCDSTTYVASAAPTIPPCSLLTPIGTLLGAFNDGDWGDLTLTAAIYTTPFGPMLRQTKELSMLYPVDISTISGSLYPVLEVDEDSITIVDHDYLRISGPMWPATAVETRAHYPRVERISTNIRTHDETVNVMGVTQPTVERPNIKSYYENKPYLDGQPVEQYVGDGAGGQIIKTGIALLSQWILDGLEIGKNSRYDVFARLSAWVNYRVLKYFTSGGELLSEDFSKEGSAQAAYYAANRSTLLSILTGNSDDEKIGIHSLPMMVEHYNTLASIVNGYRVRPSPDLETATQRTLLNVSGKIGRGLGGCNYRPRDQFISWSSDDTDFTASVEALGMTVLTSADFPAPWDDFMSGNVTWYSPPTITTDYGSGTTPLIDKWGPYHGFNTDQVDKYRWVTIEDAQAVYESLGMRFVMEELVCPATLGISVGDPTLLLDGSSAFYAIPGSYRPMGITAVQWYNDPDGDWVYTPENDVIRADVSRIDDSAQPCSAADFSNYGLYTQGLDADVETRLYFVQGMVVNPTQVIVANRYFIYRKYGDQDAKAIVWPRNYIDYERESLTAEKALARCSPGVGLFDYTPRIAKDDIEGDAPEITDLTEDETAITTAFENGKLLILPVGVSLE